MKMGLTVSIKIPRSTTAIAIAEWVTAQLTEVPLQKWECTARGNVMEITFASDPTCGNEFLHGDSEKMAATLATLAILFAGTYKRPAEFLAANKFRMAGMDKAYAHDVIKKLAMGLNNIEICDQFEVEEVGSGVNITVLTPVEELGFGYSLRVGKFATECVKNRFVTFLD